MANSLFRAQRRWTQQELALAREMHERNTPNHEIAEALGRSYRSIKSILYQPRVCAHASTGYLSAFYDGPPIGRCPTQEHLLRDAIRGSAMLRDAILAVAR